MATSMAGSSIENYVTGYDDSALKEICQLLIRKEVSLGEIVEHLGVYLTNKDTAVRARATRLLAEILNKLPTDFLSQKEGSLLTVYLCERLQDHYSLQPHALYGLLSLSSYSNLPDDCVEKICRTVFKEVHCQSLPQGDRRTIFTMISIFLASKLPELQKLGTDFVYGFIQVMDGEKDPRNLILAFQCARLVIENFPLGVFTEEMFEIVSCYFPIDFAPSATDPSGITKEDLIKELRYCLAATPKFAQYCLPLLLEKLSSDLKSAKIDSLQTLAACAEMYGSDSLREYESSFFNCIKKEVFLSGDPAVEEAGLQALTALVKTLSTGIIEVGTKRGLEGFVEEILTEVKQHLLQPELMLMLSTGRLLGAASQGSSMACCQILDTALPLLIETHDRQTEATPKYNVLQVLNRLIDTVAKFSDSSQCLNSLKPFKDSMLHIFKSSLREDVSVIQQQGVEGFRTLFSISKFLSERDMFSIGKMLILKVCEKELEKEVRQKCNDVLKFISEVHSEVVLKSLKYAVFPIVDAETKKGCGVLNNVDIRDAEMPSEREQTSSSQQDNNIDFSDTKTDDDRMNIDMVESDNPEKDEFVLVTQEEKSRLLSKNLDILETLSVVCTRVTIVRNVIQCLLDYLYWSKDLSLHIHSGVFHCFESIINNCDIESLQYLYSKVVPAVYYWIITHSHVAEWQNIVRDETVLRHLAAFLRKTVTKLSSQHESIYPAAIIKYCLPLYRDGDFTCIKEEGNLPHKTCQEFTPLQPGEDAIYTCLLTPILCSAPQKIDLPRGREFIDKLSALAETVSEVGAHTHVVKCLSGLVNKWKNEDELNSLLDHIKTNAQTTLQSADGNKKLLCVKHWAWITKALVLRGHKQASYFTDKLIDLLSDVSVGHEAAAGIAIILNPCDDVLTKEMSANIRIMYRQRFFMENLPKLAEGFESSTQETKKNYLLAASHMIKNMEKQILMPELQRVFPLLIHSLQYEDVDLQLSTMLTLSDLIENAPELVHKQMDSLIPKLLKLITYKPSMKVRIAALKCIEEMTTLPVHIVIPYRGQITRALEPALDDPKRLVRKQAVTARQEWYLLDTKSK